MSENKSRGGQDSQLTKLKALPAASREVIWSWREELVDNKPMTNAAIRNRIATQFQIRLSRDGQLSDFWSWQQHQRRLENYNVLLANFEEFYRASNPGATPEKVRAAGIAFFMTEAVANGDREGFTDVARLDLSERTAKTKAGFEERKISVSERKVKLLEQKAKQAEATEKVLSSKLTPEEKEAEYRRIFGMT